MKTALVGLMQSGTSTLFSAISGKKISPTGAVAIEEAIVPVPDERLDWLAGIYKPKKVVRATMDCLDVPGFNFADESGRAAARRLIERIRTVDMLVLVVRAFENKSVPPYRGEVDAARDFEELRTEFLLSDLELITTRIERLEKQVRKPSKTQVQDKAELELQKKLQATIEAEKPLSSAIETQAEEKLIRSLNFLTLKPMLVVVNVDENQLAEDMADKIGSSADCISLSAQLEYELSQLDDESRAEFMADLGIKEPAKNKFIESCYSTLGLISFLTVGSDEVRAWCIEKGTTAHNAAGKVHSDIKRGFIRAETFSYADLHEHGSEKALKEAGKIRLEGKDYIVKDGDIINFRFNV